MRRQRLAAGGNRRTDSLAAIAAAKNTGQWFHLKVAFSLPITLRQIPKQTLQAKALVHDAYLRLVGRDREQR